MFSSNTSQVSGGYEIQRSLRFNSADSAYLNRTPASAGNRRTWTWSGWVKRSTLGANQAFFAGNSAATDSGYTAVSFGVDNTLSIGGWNTDWRKTTQVFRDVSAWYHIVIVWDTTQATAANRVKIYVNGLEVTSFTLNVNPSLDATSGVNATSPHYISTYDAANQFFNGYMTEVNFIDGQALTPSSFGAFDAQTGVWGPTRYAGSYGTNGFYLNFSDNSNTTAATLGRDYSGNSNNWTPNNFSVSAGAGNDSLVDVPTNFGTDTGVGGTVRGNYATLNPLASRNGFGANGNLDGTVNGSEPNYILGTIAVSSGKWYWEWTPTSNLIYSMVGITLADSSTIGWLTPNSWTYWYTGSKYNNNTAASYGASFALNDIIGIALDMDAGTVTFYKNGVSQGTAYSGLTGSIVPYFGSAGGGVNAIFTANFGQRPFAYTAPSGFKALNTQNLPTPTIGATTATQAGKFFNPVLYTGNASTNNITGVGFETDFVWFKCRNVGFANVLMDRVRGITNSRLFSNNTDAESTSTTYINSTNSDGFQLAVGDNGANGSGQTYVAWNWKANGAGVTNTAGSITSTVSANTTSGFSVARGTLPSGVGASYGHGLGVAPSFIIAKSTSSASDWFVYHRSLGFNQDIRLNTTAAASSTTFTYNSANASTVTIGGGNVNAFWGANTTWVWYSFAEVPGYSRFGSYTGNGSTDGPFVFCGFRPAFIMRKRSDSAPSANESWWMQDVRRSPFNVTANVLAADRALSEADYGTTNYGIDILSNGFKIRDSSPLDNANGGTYIFMALAENPFKYSLAR